MLNFLGMPDEQFAMFDKMELALTISKEGGGYKFSFDFKGAAASYVVTVGEPVTVPMLDGTSARVSRGRTGARYTVLIQWISRLSSLLLI